MLGSIYWSKGDSLQNIYTICLESVEEATKYQILGCVVSRTFSLKPQGDDLT